MKRSFLVLCFCMLTAWLLTSFSYASAGAGKGALGKPKGEYAAGELLVKFKPSVSDSKRAEVHARLGSKQHKMFDYLRIAHVKIKDGLSVEEAISRYKDDSSVEYAEPNYKLTHYATPNDPNYSQLWGMPKINAPAAWDITTGSNTVVVADIDTGMDYNHGDLAANVWINPGEIPGNGIDDDGNGYVDDIYGIDTHNGDSNPMDDDSHGTHTAGTIGAVGNNGRGVTGVAWNVKVMPLKFMGPNGGYTSDAISCFEYVRKMKLRGINIVATNNSWGGGGYSQALYDAINAQRDILCVIAAGNDNWDAEIRPSYPASYELPNIIAVAATDSNDAKAYFSSYGRTNVHIGAPGVGILSTIPGNGYASYNGTSMATPHVTGVAALLKANNPALNMQGIKNLILSGGDDVPSMAGKTVTGRRLNANGALKGTGSLLSPQKYPMYPNSGDTYVISALSIVGSQATDPVTVSSTGGVTTTLKDDGVAPDLYANDAIFSGYWTFTDPTDSILTFSSLAGSKTIDVNALAVTKVPGNIAGINDYFSDFVKAQGGYPPYSWSVSQGQLPPGLSLNDSTGEISGIPTQMGTFECTVQVNDTRTSATREMKIEVGLDAIWKYDTGRADYAGENIATDTEGNVYLAGTVASGTNYDYQLVKLSPQGSELWSRTFDGGFDDYGYGVAVDAGGFVYITGGSIKEYQIFGNLVHWYLCRTIKYDAGGNIVWIKEFPARFGENSSYGSGISVDGAGSIYVAATTGNNGSWVGGYVVKYDQNGNEIWATQDRSGAAITNDIYGNTYTVGGSYITKYDPAGARLWGINTGYSLGRGAAADSDGNVYVAGKMYVDFKYTIKTSKYSPTGNLLWSKTYGAAGIDFLPNGINVDVGGNVYIAGNSLTTAGADYLLLKYTTSGELISVRTKNLSTDDYGLDIAIGNNAFYVSGELDNGRDYDAFVIKYPLDTVAPLVTSFVVPATSVKLNVPITSFAATDNMAVIGYLVTESAAKPLNSDLGWSATPQTSYTFLTGGTKTLYAWVKDAEGNISSAVSANVTLTITPPTVVNFVVPALTNSVNVPITSFTATDDLGISGYMITESPSSPSPAALGWSASPPVSYQVAKAGARTLYAWAKDLEDNVSAGVSANVYVDTTAPTVLTFAAPATSGTLTVPITSFTATDDVGVTGYVVTESVMYPSNNDPRWSETPQLSYTFTSGGTKTLYAWARDAGGNISGNLSSATILVTVDTPPAINFFSAPATSNSFTFYILFTATDNSAVVGYMITESPDKPLATAAGWSATPLNSYTATTEGVKVLYGWVKDDTNNVSDSKSCTVKVDMTPPTVASFSIPLASTTLTIPISSLTATDNIGVTGYMVTESSTKPLFYAAGWTSLPPTSFTFASNGTKTLYAWAKDENGNVSTGVSATVSLGPDTTPPTVTSFSMPASSNSLTVPISAFIATDNIGVTGYLLTESSVTPLATAVGWTATAPASYTFATAGTKILYPWAIDAAGNVSVATSGASIVITVDTTPPGAPTFSTLAGLRTGLGLKATWKAAVDNSGGSGIASYDVYRSTSSNGTYTKINTTPIPATQLTYTDSSIKAATTYYYYIKAVDNAGNTSAASATRSGKDS